MTALADDVAASYDALAPAYDLLTGGHDHAAWASAVEGLARRAGLDGRRLLDVGCGTGNLIAPMLARGYEVTGVDVSPGMLAVAREKLGSHVRLQHADMRELPALGGFDLVWSLGDAVNYLLTDAELVAAFAGMARNLASGGVLAFDVVTLSAFRAMSSAILVAPADDRVVLYEGRAEATPASGAIVEAWIDRLERTGGDGWRRFRSLHRQRHLPRPVLARALAATGLVEVGAWGTDGAAALTEPPDEDRHAKAVYIARHGAPSGAGR
jgi:SAM-dependent methyltransferase